MPRLPHGAVVTRDAILNARDAVIAHSSTVDLAFAAATPTALQDFAFLFPELQDDPRNLLIESATTRDALILLGRSMQDRAGAAANSAIPAAYTYLGQFIDHDITLDVVSGGMPRLLDPALAPMTAADIRGILKNARTATLDLDSVYGLPAIRDGDRMRVGTVTRLHGAAAPRLRPAGKDDSNDLPREPRGGDHEHDRAALTGDPRNDENTIVSQLHVAFLRAHNALVTRGMSFADASKTLRQHYQHIVLHDFLPRVANPAIVATTIAQNRVFDGLAEPQFMPLEFSVAAFRFGHSMVRDAYDFNVNFNLSGSPGTMPASLGLLFTFTALSGQLGNFDSLPDNWIVEWERLIDAGRPFQTTRRIDPQLVEPLFSIPNDLGEVPADNAPDRDAARLAVRNLLRGYLLRMPTGQAVVRAVNARIGIAEVPALSAAELEAAAADDTQRDALRAGGFLDRTPLWYYILAEARALGHGERLGPLGSTLVAEVLVGLVRRSENSILRTQGWAPSLPSNTAGTFVLADLLRLAGVLSEATPENALLAAAGGTIAGSARATAADILQVADMNVRKRGGGFSERQQMAGGNPRTASITVPGPGSYEVTIVVTSPPATAWEGSVSLDGAAKGSSGTRSNPNGNDSFFVDITVP